MYGASGTLAHQELQRAFARIERLGGTRRFWEMDRLERYYGGKQHDGKASWWDGTVPARERKPVVLSGLPKAAVEQAVRFTLGEGKFPDLRFEPTESPKTIGGISFSLSDEEAKTLDGVWSEIAKQIKVKVQFREALRRGLSMRTACGVYSLRGGMLALEMLNAKHCQPTWDETGKRTLVALECRYIFPREERQSDGTTKEVWYWYRRVIDTERDTVFREVKVDEGDEPNWTPDPARSIEHNTGHCPAFWFANLPRMDLGDDDGIALIDGCEDEIDAIDYALSVRHTGAFVWGTPQGWQTGVMDGAGPAATGRVAVEYFPDGEGNQRGYIDPSGFGGGAARKRSAFSVWNFEEVDVKVGLLEASGSAGKSVTDHVTDLRARLLESIQVVLVDPASVAGQSDMSAKLLELLYAPLLALVDDLRECWGAHLQELVSGLLRFVLVHGVRDPASVFIPGLDAALPIMQRFLVPVSTGALRWLPPAQTMVWGDYFAPTNTDVRDAVIAAKSALGQRAAGSSGGGVDVESKPLISHKTAVRYVASYFGVEDIDAELAEIEQAEAEAEKVAAEKQAAETEALHKLAGGMNGDPKKSSGYRAGGGGKPPPTADD